MRYDAIVIGGGLAGCSVAHQLARRDHDVLLLEASTYPRHKLCGEFLSPEAQVSLRRLGVLDAVHAAGAASVSRALLTGPRGGTSAHDLPGTALGLSRYRLDELLYRQACAAGVEGRTGTRVSAVHGALDRGFSVEAGGISAEARLVVGAYGRRGVLDRTLDRPFLREQSPYVAFKAHYAGSTAALPDAIELHAASGGYCGVGPVEDGRANVCWIGRTDALTAAGGSPEAMLDEVLRRNPALDDRMRGLSRVSGRFEAVSQVPLMPKSRFANDVCMVGDAAGMIAPLCGDGMAMALDAADLLAPLAADWLAGRQSTAAFRTAYRRQWRRRFGRRMRIGRWVHAAAFRPTFTTALLRACTALPPLARWLIRATRGSGPAGAATGPRPVGAGR
jgi:flavin-dependent dehydrogenase